MGVRVYDRGRYISIQRLGGEGGHLGDAVAGTTAIGCAQRAFG